MKKSLGMKAYVLPQPVAMIATYDENGTEDVMNAAWFGQCGGKEISVSLSKSAEHQTTANILREKAFTVSFADVKHLVPCDYVGLVSKKDTPAKIEKSGFTFEKSENVHAPVIAELPIALECRLVKTEEEYGEVRVVGEIVNTLVDESIIEKGAVNTDLLELLSLDITCGAYRLIGEKKGRAFHDGIALK